jgi:hypothetical protein
MLARTALVAGLLGCSLIYAPAAMAQGGNAVLVFDGYTPESDVDRALRRVREQQERDRAVARNNYVNQLMRNMNLPPHRRAEAERLADMEARSRTARGLTPYPMGAAAAPSGQPPRPAPAPRPSTTESAEEMRARMLRNLPPNSPCARYLRARGQGWSVNPCV